MNMMEWDHGNQQSQQQQEQVLQGQMEGPQYQSNGVVNGLYVKVMTDEQMELLRKQICVYATICEQLVDMHKAMSAQHDLAGMRLGNMYCDPLMVAAGNKITARQRWTPTPLQLQILEGIYDQGNGTPSKQKIKEITTDLAQHGQITENNVYNWFQNRRARSKRKQSITVPNNGDSEVETEMESPKDKKTKPENIQSHDNSALRADIMYFHSPEMGIEHLIGKMDVQGNFSPYRQVEQYDVIG